MGWMDAHDLHEVVPRCVISLAYTQAQVFEVTKRMILNFSGSPLRGGAGAGGLRTNSAPAKCGLHEEGT